MADEAAGRRLERSLIIALIEQLIVEVAHKELVDQLRHGAAAAAVGQRQIRHEGGFDGALGFEDQQPAGVLPVDDHVLGPGAAAAHTSPARRNDPTPTRTTPRPRGVRF